MDSVYHIFFHSINYLTTADRKTSCFKTKRDAGVWILFRT